MFDAGTDRIHPGSTPTLEKATPYSRKCQGVHIAVACMLGLLAACGDDPGGPSDPAAASIEIVAGTGQAGEAGVLLADTVVVRIVDADDAPVDGAQVSFAITAGGGTVSPSSATTGMDGLARTAWTLGTAEGEQELQATVTGSDIAPAVFNAEATAVVSATTSAATIAEAAVFIHDEVSAGRPIAAALEPLFSRLGVHIVDVATEGDQLAALLEAGEPVVFDVQLAALERAYVNGIRVSVGSFVSALADRDVTLDGAPITLDALTDVFASIAGMTEHDAETLLPALVMELGRERARRSTEGITDPVWGDGWLDPLQFTLLVYAAHYSAIPVPGEAGAVRELAGAHARAVDAQAVPYGPRLDGAVRVDALSTSDVQRASAAANPLVKFGRGKLAGMIGKRMEMPLTAPQAASGSLCVSVVVYGYGNTVTVEPPLVFRPPQSPDVSAVTAQLSFNDEYEFIVKSVMSDIGCNIPEKGTAAGAGKSLSWSLSGQLPEHGDLDLVQETTDANGRGTATYRTRHGDTPELLRIAAVDDVGTVDVSVSGLVGGWAGLEMAIGLGVWNPLDVGGLVFVRHYPMPQKLRLSYRVDVFAGTAEGGQSAIVTGTGDLVLQADSMTYAGTVTAFYESGTFTPLTAECEVQRIAGEFNVTVNAMDDPNGFNVVWPILTGDTSARPQERLLCQDSPPIDLNAFVSMLAAMYGNDPLIEGWVQVGATLRAVVSRSIPFGDAALTEESTLTLEVIQ